MNRSSRSRAAGRPQKSLAPIATTHPTRGSLEWDAGSAAYLFSSAPADGVQYRVPFDAPEGGPALFRIEGRVGEGPWQPLVCGAGPLAREEGGAVLAPGEQQERFGPADLRHSARGRILSLRYSQPLGGPEVRCSIQLRLTGDSLELAVEAPADRALCGFTLGEIGSEGAREVNVSGLPDPLLVLPEGGFAAAYADRFLGDAFCYPPGAARYRATHRGEMPPVRETFYVTISADPLDPLPAQRQAPAPLRAAVTGRVTLDWYSEAPYAEDTRRFRMLSLYGLQDILLIYRNWQHFGYRRRDPYLYPANPERGDPESFRELLDAAREGGWLVALREEYAMMKPDSPFWHEALLARWIDGQPRPSRGGAFAVAAGRMTDVARLQASDIRRNYGPLAVFADAHTAWNPEDGLRQISVSRESNGASESRAIAEVDALFQLLRECHEGPVLGGAGQGASRFDALVGGMAEAVVRGPEDGLAGPLIVDYELTELRPSLLGIGAGAYRQFHGQAGGETVDLGVMEWDRYRASTLALGHLGYLGTYGLKPRRGEEIPPGAALLAREYFLIRAVQEIYAGSTVRAVSYLDGEELVDLATALQRNLDLSQARLHVEYTAGLRLWVNRSAKDRWRVVTEEGAEHDLPPGGFVALSPRHKLEAWSALVSGQHADYCRSERYTYLNTRGRGSRRVGELQVDGAVALLKSAVPGRQDVVLIGCRQVSVAEEEYRLSERADVRLTHVSTRELELTVLATESGKPAHVAWPAFTAAWKANEIRVEERTRDGWAASKCQVQQTRSGPQLSRAVPGVTYRLSAPTT
ncbi:MAG: hypothetical protein ACK47B_28600 [Armatimonadota bacterium]